MGRHLYVQGFPLPPPSREHPRPRSGGTRLHKCLRYHWPLPEMCEAGSWRRSRHRQEWRRVPAFPGGTPAPKSAARLGPGNQLPGESSALGNRASVAVSGARDLNAGPRERISTPTPSATLRPRPRAPAQPAPRPPPPAATAGGQVSSWGTPPTSAGVPAAGGGAQLPQGREGLSPGAGTRRD